MRLFKTLTRSDTQQENPFQNELDIVELDRVLLCLMAVLTILLQ